MDMYVVMRSLEIMGKGMLAIFVVIFVIYVFVQLMSVLGGRKRGEQEPQDK